MNTRPCPRKDYGPALGFLVFCLFALAGLVTADEQIYADSLNPVYQSWSWSSTPNFQYTGSPRQGAYAIRAPLGQYGGFSLWRSTGPFPGKGISFYIAWDRTKEIKIWLDATGAGVQSDFIDIKKFIVSGTPSLTTFAKCTVDLSLFNPPRTDWTRFSIGDTGGNSPVLIIDTINVVSNLPPPPPSVALFGPRGLLFTSVASTVGVSITVNGVSKPIAKSFYDATSKKLLVQLGSYGAAILPPGARVDVSLPNNRKLSLVVPSIIPITLNVATTSYPVSPLIYGHAFAPPASMTALRIPSNRWGGNAETAYNPFKNVTNAGNDWFFENRHDDGVPNFIQTNRLRSSKSFFSIPALDWVSKDATSYSYPRSIYPSQQSFDPWNSDAGNGLKPDGTPIRADPRRAYEAWNQSRIREWLGVLKGKGMVPEFVAVDNELDIAASTHRDMHWDKATYGELLKRVQDTADSVKSVGLVSKVAAPSSCCWYYYWNSDAGAGDKTLNGGMDFLPWFLAKMSEFSTQRGKRMLDYLDIHYYPNNVFSSASDPETRAQRLRATRSLWDPTYKDEGWIGRDGQWSTQQPNPNFVYLIPRFKSLIAKYYPGTMLAINEWNFGGESDISGGLAVADVLGIFARERLEMAHYWTSPGSGTPAWLGFWVFRGGSVPFGARYAPLGFPTGRPNPNFAGVYAARTGTQLTLLLINKHPTAYQAYEFGTGIPRGKYSVKYFGQSVGIRAQQTAVCTGAGDTIWVPPYAAVFLGYLSGTC